MKAEPKVSDPNAAKQKYAKWKLRKHGTVGELTMTVGKHGQKDNHDHKDHRSRP